MSDGNGFGNISFTNRAAGHQPFEGLDHQLFGFGVECRGRFIEDEGSRDRDALTLTARQPDENARGTLFTVQKALPLFNDGGSIFMTGSIASDGDHTGNDQDTHRLRTVT